MTDGIDWSRRRQPCLSQKCARGPADKAMSTTRRDDGSYLGHCFRCGGVFFSDEGTPTTGRASPPRAVVPLKREALSSYGCELWAACRPLSGPALAYLKARGCRIPPSDADLRWHPELRHSDDYRGPALVGLITAASDHRKAMSLHFTWIRADGTKADITPPRRYLGGHAKAGGVVRLWPDDCVTHSLGVAEGIETALTLAHFHQPTWACLDAGNLAALLPLAGLEELVISADHDAAGIAAAQSCRARWKAAGVRVTARMHPRPGCDLNDLRAAHAAA